MRLGIIGGGNMGGAILLALVKAEVVSPENILLIEPDKEKRDNLTKTTNCVSKADIDETIREYDLLLIAVKPQAATPAMELLAQWILPHQLVISVMAGISLETMQSTLIQTKLVRVMPNIPTLIAEGMSIFFASSEVDKVEREWVKTLFFCMWKVSRGKR